MSETNLARFRAAVAGALAQLESRRAEVNDLNVFPVADGDTGDNMALTLGAVLAELDRLQAGDEERTIDEIGREEIVQSVARAALLGARGNSGVILSQLIRGAAEELVSRPGELIDPSLVGAALAKAADRAYASVRDPAEGTILTVAREMATQIMSDVAHSEHNPRLGAGAEPEEQNQTLAETLERALEAGLDAVRRGPELLVELREAGVVDAGGYALTVIFAGVIAVLRGDDPPEIEHHAPARVSHPQHSSSTYRFCTNFAVSGAALEAGRFIEPLEALGDSVLVVGDASTLKVHVHTDHPDRATALFEGHGRISHIDVADMDQQVIEREERLGAGAGAAAGANGGGAHAPRHSRGGDENGAPAGAPGAGAAASRARCGALAVVSGEGLAELLGSLGLHTIDGGPTMNPSTTELHAAIHEIDAEEILVLPGSPNVLMVAEQAAAMSDRQVQVLPATSQQATLAAAVSFDPAQGMRENAEALGEALARVRTGAVAEAARDDAQGRFRRGEAVGFVEEQIVSWGDPRAALAAVLAELRPGAELISVLAGQDPPLAAEEVRGLMNGEGEVALEFHEGRQPAYWWLLSAE